MYSPFTRRIAHTRILSLSTVLHRFIATPSVFSLAHPTMYDISYEVTMFYYSDIGDVLVYILLLSLFYPFSIVNSVTC